ncbi:Protoheme IX farnesyltransferase, mitochondrial [Wickerhamomyces ciferrii]|uniref:Protoheme IX farnesyltransferase, mitochondrial n=1 Tax=Wickerhamomyces ciferrii (strain ATCC 14091 / BCRC 22168 / CBS 111 / JCM 3599 / NBRC 0793 / NRRL Y-1031 F-60-10) TaxID=1206466 RepID=K0KIY4_WICCF|nr:Protoheme IX farnesyltransferase, mitochondrial [Wickerhamomyces ciferrii]CCH42936.1 Protoheme IX farnesyltransferase, mitochondrial [Wickerhamomyces ciferrii]
MIVLRSGLILNTSSAIRNQLYPISHNLINLIKKQQISQKYKYSTQSTSAASQESSSSLDTSPIEFISNLTPPTFNDKITKALSCTSDTSDSSPSITSSTSTSTSSDPSTLKTSHIPFEVKQKIAKESSTDTDIIKDETTKEKSLAKIIDPYVALSKPRLTALVTLSAICSYALTPFSATVPELMFLTIGTCLSSASANAINMGREPNFDRLMVRTLARPVVRGLVTPDQAYKFAAVTGTLGVSILYLGVNPTVAVLSGLNIVLYSWIYTSLKRRSILNTWVGAIVGAIPPLMGWAASSPLTHPGAWCLAALLYAWQFPHFNALSHNIRNEYRNAGYVMTCFTNPRLNARVGFRYALLMFPLCFFLSYYDVTDWVFPIDSAILNGWLSYWSFKFWYQQRLNYKNGGTPDPQGMKLANMYAKKAFWGSVWHLPGVLVLAMLHKKGRWDWIFGKSESTLKP